MHYNSASPARVCGIRSIHFSIAWRQTSSLSAPCIPQTTDKSLNQTVSSLVYLEGGGGRTCRQASLLGRSRHMAHLEHHDEALLARFVSTRDAGALGSLADRYESQLLGLARALLRGREDLARDVVQETWLRVIRFGSTFRADASFKTWLYRILTSQCSTMLAQCGRNEKSSAIEALRLVRTTSAPAQRNVPNDDAELMDAVHALSGPKRDVLLLCYHADLTHEIAAEILEIPLGTLKSRLNAALSELRVVLKEEASA